MKHSIKKPLLRRYMGLGLTIAILGVCYYVFIDFHHTYFDVNFQVFFAKQIEWCNPASYHFPFYPSLWPVIIKLVGVDSWNVAYMILTPIIMGVTAFSLSLLLHFLGGKPTHIVLVVLCVHVNSVVFLNSINGLSDGFFTMVWVLALLAALVYKRWFIFGIFLGIMCLLRHHGFLFASMSIIMVLYLAKKRVYIGYYLLGILLMYLPQIIIDLSAGKWPLETNQLYNVYKTFYNDIKPEDLQLPKDLFNQVLHHPTRVVTRYFWFVKQYWFLFGAVPLLWVVAIRRKHKMANVMLFTIAGLLLVSTFASSQRIIPPISVVLVVVFTMLNNAHGFTLKRYFNFCLVLFLFFNLYGFLNRMYILKNQIAYTKTIEQKLVTKIKDVNNDTKLEDVFIMSGVPVLHKLQDEIPYLGERQWFRYNNLAYNKKYPSITVSEIINEPDSMKRWVKRKLDFLVVKFDNTPAGTAQRKKFARTTYLQKQLAIPVHFHFYLWCPWYSIKENSEIELYKVMKN